MVKVAIEEHIKVVNGIYEIKIKNYMIPDQIIYKGVLLNYDSYHNCYVSYTDSTILSPKEYLQWKLQEEREKQNNNTEIEL